MTPKEWMQNVRQLMMLLRAKSESLQNIPRCSREDNRGNQRHQGPGRRSVIQPGSTRGYALADMYDDAIEELDSLFQGALTGQKKKKGLSMKVEDAR